MNAGYSKHAPDSVYARYAATQLRRQKQRRRLQRISMVLLLSLAGFLLIAARPWRHSGAADSTGSTDFGFGRTAVQASSAPSPVASVPGLTAYSANEDDLALGLLNLVSNAYPCTFPPGLELVNVFTSGNGSFSVRETDIMIRQDVMEPLNQLCAALQSATGNNDLLVCAGYRSQEEQQALWDNALSNHGIEYTRQYFSQPGSSEHHTGLAVDFAFYQVDQQRSYEFDGSGDSQWMLEHCWEYGFVQRYPLSKVDITGISEEAWHFRYVGQPHATLMHQKDLCLEEYIALLQAYPWDGEHLVETVAGTEYEIWYCPADNIQVPMQGTYTLSGDHQGGCIVTAVRAQS